MMQPQELQREQRFAARVQQLLSAAIDKAKGFADEHMESIRLMLVDAWEELRLKPTALSPKDLNSFRRKCTTFSRGTIGARRTSASTSRCCSIRSLPASISRRRAIARWRRSSSACIRSPTRPRASAWCTIGARRCARCITIPCGRGGLQQPLGRDAGQDAAQAAVQDGERPPRVLYRYRGFHRRRDPARHPFRRHHQPHAADRFHHPEGAERGRALRQRAPFVRGGRGGLGENLRGHAPRGLFAVPLSRFAGREAHRDSFALQRVQRIHFHRAARAGRGKHPLGHAERSVQRHFGPGGGTAASAGGAPDGAGIRAAPRERTP